MEQPCDYDQILFSSLFLQCNPTVRITFLSPVGEIFYLFGTTGLHCDYFFRNVADGTLTMLRVLPVVVAVAAAAGWLGSIQLSDARSPRSV